MLSRTTAAAARKKSGNTSEESPKAPAEPQRPARTREVRYTLDLEQHMDFKRFSLEADAASSEVMLALLHSDTRIRNTVLTAISKNE